MSAYVEIRNQIQKVADLAGGIARLAMGKPGSTIEIGGEDRDTGAAWGSAKSLDIYLQGIGKWLDQQDVSGGAAQTAKINEIVAAYNQFRTDYNAAVVPTTAPALTPL